MRRTSAMVRRDMPFIMVDHVVTCLALSSVLRKDTGNHYLAWASTAVSVPVTFIFGNWSGVIVG
ncbi:hypothetical protein [Sulfobacillus thermosulfidooxidans]|uniref:hypothetical protein n=1 Tax=Sulfobacillus thermosulfidooxidans TaxID=28034 RepID=UPI00117D7C45|nr:hypothetical protein [Sulfobacillus thermosulfidooxidans]